MLTRKNLVLISSLALLSQAHTTQPLTSTDIKVAAYVTIAAAALCYTAPPAYRIGRYINFKAMSYEARMTYAYPFYLKVAEYYLEAINKDVRNEADLQTIVSSGYRISHSRPSWGKRFWRFIDYKRFNRFKKRERLAKYPFLYYEDKLRTDIGWLEYYINHMLVGGPERYAKKKQEMRNLLADLKRLLVEIQRSRHFEKERRLMLKDTSATHVNGPHYNYQYDFVHGT